jgi:hypothetical protein
MTRSTRRASTRTPQTPFDNASQVYEVQAIEAKRRKGGNTEYFVLWKDHQPSDNTWEPMSNLEGSEALVNDFEKTWQDNYDAAEAKASQDRERRRQNARQPHNIVDSPLEQAQNINRVAVSDATEQRAASAAVSSAGGMHTTLLPLLLLD